MASHNTAFDRRVRALRAADPTLALSQARTQVRADDRARDALHTAATRFREQMGMTGPVSPVPVPVPLALGHDDATGPDLPTANLDLYPVDPVWRHLVISGGTGSGKTHLTLALITGLIARHSARTVSVLHLTGDRRPTVTHPDLTHRYIPADRLAGHLNRLVTTRARRAGDTCRRLRPLVIVADYGYDTGTEPWAQEVNEAVRRLSMTGRELRVTLVRTVQTAPGTQVPDQQRDPNAVYLHMQTTPVPGGTPRRTAVLGSHTYPLAAVSDPLAVFQTILDTPAS